MNAALPDAQPAIAAEAARGPVGVLRRLRLLDAAPCTRLESLAVAGFLLALAFAVFGIHVARGALSFDDWTLAYDVHHGGFFGSFHDLLTGDVLTGKSPARPVEVAYNVIVYSLFGQHAALHLALGVVLAALVAFLFYLVLRRLHLERLHAGAIATLVLLFPAADSTVFWVTGAIAHVTVALYLLGLICTLRAFRAQGRVGLVLHGAAIVLYAASILQYQIAAPFILLSVLVYRLGGTSWRRSVRRWGVDVAVALGALAFVQAKLDRQKGSLGDDLRHAKDIARGARRLLESLGVLNGANRLPTIGMVVLLLIFGAAAVWLPARDTVRQQLRRWLFIVGAGFVTIGSAYAIFVPGDFYYYPLTPGIGNRVNAAAALGFGLVFYGLAVLVGLLIGRVVSRTNTTSIAAGIACAATLALAVAYISELNSDRRPYDRAASLQREALAVVRHEVPRPAPNTTVYLFGIDGEITPNVFTFVRTNDLTAALRLLWKDDTLAGVPVSSTAPDWPGNSPEDSGITCGAAGVQPHGWLFDHQRPTRYGRTLFVDVQTRSSALIRSSSGCRVALGRYLRQS